MRKGKEKAFFFCKVFSNSMVIADLRLMVMIMVLADVDIHVTVLSMIFMLLMLIFMLIIYVSKLQPELVTSTSLLNKYCKRENPF